MLTDRTGQTPQARGPATTRPRPRELRVYLIKASKYDDDGYVIRHWRGVLPSNTLSCMAALTQAVADRGELGPDVRITMEILDEAVHFVNVRRIVRQARRPGVKAVVCLVGVQTNQFPRAADLARQFRAAGLTVLIGGFHVSGSLAMLPGVPREIQELLDLGVTVVKGEVEEVWGDILKAAYEDRLEPIYDRLNDLPDLSRAPIPKITPSYLKRFAYRHYGTIDCGRGCPFNCSFCTIINVQGRKMRMRDAAAIRDAVRENYHKAGIDFYFFTDDNMARNKNWAAIFDAMAALREREGIPVQFMMQVDTLSYKTPGFVERAKAGGCTQVFIGMESLNPKNLEAATKNQNHADDYKNLIGAWRAAGVTTHVGYIIGFPFDTVASVLEDLDRLKNDIKVDVASFFMLTPLPGSADHQRMFRAGVYMDPDFNKYDSFHPTIHHPNMTAEEWFALYQRAWREFYSFENMRAVLLRATRDTYWNIFRNFLWYKAATHVEGGHPMITGFLRFKDRTTRRPGFPILSRWAHLRMRARELRALAAGYWRLFLELEELWLQTREASGVPTLSLQEVRELLARQVGKVGETIGDVVDRARRAASHRVHSLAHAAASAAHAGAAAAQARAAAARTMSREELRRFWAYTAEAWRRGQLHRINLARVAANAWRDLALMVAFYTHLSGNRVTVAEPERA
ncbi:MAG TPA: radical SAM protein [Thermodesulfobacteriota bacterium]|nr:radical SAM protein [Thermodesulfobacteriota bacterium]